MEATKLAKLEKQLLYTGLGDIPSDQLKSKVSEGLPEFSIPFSKKFGEDEVTGEARFRKGKEDYFFNSYQANVKPENGERTSIIIKVQTPDPVTLENGKKEWINSTITLKEAYNLTQGRSINQDFVKVDKEQAELNRKYNAWQVQDFKNPNDDGSYPLKRIYNFDIEATLAQYPIKELLNDQYKAQLLDSLKRGNLQSVTFLSPDGTEEKMKIEANAAFKTINIYDDQMNRVSLSMKVQQTPPQQDVAQEQDNTNSKKNDQKQDKNPADADDGPGKVAKNKKKGLKGP